MLPHPNKMWNCVEIEHVEQEAFTRRRREIIFDHIYESEAALNQQNPIRVNHLNIKVSVGSHNLKLLNAILRE